MEMNLYAIALINKTNQEMKCLMVEAENKSIAIHAAEEYAGEGWRQLETTNYGPATPYHETRVTEIV